jgi:hypothetical protein
MRTDPCFEKWCAWLRIIEHDVSMLLFHRRIFSETKDIVEKNNRIDLNHPYFSFFVITYMDSVVMGIRRQTKDDQDSISLARLLGQVAKKPQLVTRSDHYELYENFRDRIGSRIVDKLRQQTFDKYAFPGSEFIDSARVTSDRDELKEICKEAETFADRRVAHWDRREPPADLNLDTIFKALDTLETLIMRYHVLFFAEEISLTPGLPCPISDVFREPWFVS